MDPQNIDGFTPQSFHDASTCDVTTGTGTPVTESCNVDPKLDVPRHVILSNSTDDVINDDATDNQPCDEESDTDTASETEDCFVDAMDNLHVNAAINPPASTNSFPNTSSTALGSTDPSVTHPASHARGASPCAATRDHIPRGDFPSNGGVAREKAYDPTQFDDDDEEEDRIRVGENEGEGDGEIKADVIDEEALRAAEALLSEEEIERRRAESRRLKEAGNEQYKMADYAGAACSYTDALVACLMVQKEDRAVLYANRAAAQMRLDKNDAAIADCSKALELNPDYMKALLRRAELYERTDKLDEALADYQRALERDPGLHQARAACLRLPEQIQVRNEKLKDEMLSKLKDLGNLVLRPFGLSTDNFQMQKDPVTGSYSINFQQRAPS